MSMEQKWFLNKMAQEAVGALWENGFDATYIEEHKELISKLNDLIPDGSSIGFGGSRTLEECGVLEWLRQKKSEGGMNVLDRDEPGISSEERTKRMKSSLSVDYFFSGINGIGLDGTLVFIDGYGNRVGPILYGPEHVILVSGANKVTLNKNAALSRAKETAAPLNSFRLQRSNPCAKTGHCHNCKSEERICNYTVILDKDPYRGRVKIFLIGEELGL